MKRNLNSDVLPLKEPSTTEHKKPMTYGTGKPDLGKRDKYAFAYGNTQFPLERDSNEYLMYTECHFPYT
jgi:hypothetical protein